MSLIEPDIWKQIESAGPAGDELVGRQAVPNSTSRVLAAVDSRGRRHLLVLLEQQDEPFRDASSRGLSAQTEDLTVRESQRARYINILCEDPAGHSMLDLIGGEIAERLVNSLVPPAELVSRVLAKWRRFWGHLPRQILTREAQIGLFAELWFLAYWLLPAVGVSQAVAMWRGPYGARHDFERQGLSIEAKGSSSSRGRIHTINGIEQLEEPENGHLFFFSMRLREEAGAGNSLPLLCQATRQHISADPEAEGLFDVGLITAGYLATHLDEYAKTRWRVVEEQLFRVDKDFPRIVRGSFPAGQPIGVEALDYEINLGAFDHLVIARRPGEAAPLLAGN
jgi:hypothetical protein